MKKTLEQIKQTSIGEWVSITPEVRPSAQKNEDGTLKPYYSTREFKYSDGGAFELISTTFADSNGKVPLMKATIKGHITWQGEHPVAEGAQKVYFSADENFEVTPLLPAFTDVLNKIATNGFDAWGVGKTQSVFKKAFAPFGLAEGQIFSEYDLIYVFNDMMFWGARNIDGRGFDTEANRPTNLQIPMVRK